MIMYMSEEIYRDIIAVTNRHLCGCSLPRQLEKVCRGRPQAVLLREKDLSETEYALLAGEITAICRTYDVPCILHTFINTARKLQCPAIHLPLHLLREHQDELNAFDVIGTSIHSLEEALEARLLGATYLTAGHIYATDCKKGMPPCGLEFLHEICINTPLPVYAIGGIKLDKQQLDEIRQAGAKGACIMSGMMTL